MTPPSHPTADRERRNPVASRRTVMCLVVRDQPIYDPDQLVVEGITRSTLFRLDVRVLKLNCPAICGLHVCDVSLTVVGVLDNLLPIFGKLILPVAVPWGFILPPRITIAGRLMSPVPSMCLRTAVQRSYMPRPSQVKGGDPRSIVAAKRRETCGTMTSENVELLYSAAS